MRSGETITERLLTFNNHCNYMQSCCSSSHLTITERLLTFNKIDAATIRVEISDLQLTHTRGQQARKGKATETAQRFEAEANSSDAACARLTSATIAVGRC